MKFTLFIILFFSIMPGFSQNVSTNEVDSILKESFQKFAEFELIESTNLAKKALQLSSLDDYSKGKVISNIYIAKVLTEVGLNMEALKYIQTIYKEPFFNEEVIFQAESHRLRGKIYGSQKLYTLANEEFKKQLTLSERITDLKKKNLSKLWAYQNIEHIYALQEVNDSIEKYQELQEEQLSLFDEQEVTYNISTLYANRGRLYTNTNRFDEAAVQLQKSIDLLDKYNFPYKYYTLRLFGNLEAARGNREKAVFYYNKALENSSSLNVTSSSRDIHKELADYLFKKDTLIDKAKDHQKEYAFLNDSLENHNRMLANTILENIIKDNDESSAQKKIFFLYIVIGLTIISIIIGYYLFIRHRKSEKNLIKRGRQLTSKEKKIELLEEELESNIFNDIIKLAKSNNPEFLPLFGEVYPEFIEAMKQLNPTIRSSELYFCALAYLNFSTKDIANFTFVTTRAVQMRRNRIRKKYDITSEVDFNEWFRSIEKAAISLEEDVDD